VKLTFVILRRDAPKSGDLVNSDLCSKFFPRSSLFIAIEVKHFLITKP
jgi:hypothetical protein